MPHAHSSGSNSGSSAGYTPKSDYAYYKAYGGFNNFMHMHGLKSWDHDDIQEGKRIIEAMREADRQEWEEEQRRKAVAKQPVTRIGTVLLLN